MLFNGFEFPLLFSCKTAMKCTAAIFSHTPHMQNIHIQQVTFFIPAYFKLDMIISLENAFLQISCVFLAQDKSSLIQIPRSLASLTWFKV